MHVLLSETQKWNVDRDEIDLRGQTVKDPSETPLGRVQDLIIDTDSAQVAGVELGDGARFWLRDLRVDEEGTLYAHMPSEASTEHLKNTRPLTDFDQSVHQPEPDQAPSAPKSTLENAGYIRDFRSHFDEHVRRGTTSFTRFEPAYRFGFAMARKPHFQNRSFKDVEERLRDQYQADYPDHDFDEFRRAIEYGYTRYAGAPDAPTPQEAS